MGIPLVVAGSGLPVDVPCVGNVVASCASVALVHRAYQPIAAAPLCVVIIPIGYRSIIFLHNYVLFVR